MTGENFRVGYLQVRCDQHVASVTMDRPAKLNAMTREFWGALRETLDRLAADSSIRAVIIKGGGDRAFSAGGDIQGFLELQSDSEIRAYQTEAMAAFVHVERSPLIVIAAVRGIAFGGGCELALACDIVIAGESARFAFPEAALGLVPGYGVVRAPRVIGRQLTKYLIASGDSLDAGQALQAGLVQQVVPDPQLDDEAIALAKRIATRSPRAVAVAKRMVNEGLSDDDIAFSIDEVSRLQASRDRANGIKAFLDRRVPIFEPREEV
jgi:enoyl-CoA hydratase